MPIDSIPEVEALYKAAGERMKKVAEETCADIEDLRAALSNSEDPEEIVSEYEGRRLMRKIPDEAVEQ